MGVKFLFVYAPNDRTDRQIDHLCSFVKLALEIKKKRRRKEKVMLETS